VLAERRPTYAAIAALGLLRILAGVSLGFRPFDDTYITFRYARNLALGEGFVYNGGDPVLGTTSPLWTLMLAGSQILGGSMEAASLWIALVADAGTALVLVRLLSRLGYPPPIPLAAAVVFLFSFDFLSISRSGMEESIFVFLVMAALERLAAGSPVWAATLSALACLARPEGIVLIAVGAVIAWLRRSSGSPVRTWLAMGSMVTILGIWATYAAITFGSAIPQSIRAKAAASDLLLTWFSWSNVALFFIKGQYGGEIFTRTYLQLTPVTTVLALVATLSLLMQRRPRHDAAHERIVLLLMFPASYLGGHALAGAFTYHPWYYAPLYPFLAALTVIGVARLESLTRRSLVLGTCAVLVSAQLVAASAVKLPRDRSFWLEGYRQLASTLPRHPVVTVAAPEIGVVGWVVWPSRVLDLVGLVSPEAVGIPPLEAIKRGAPDYLVLRTDNAAELLRDADADQWFRRHYTRLQTISDPHEPREFRTYQKVPVATHATDSASTVR